MTRFGKPITSTSILVCSSFLFSFCIGDVDPEWYRASVGLHPGEYIVTYEVTLGDDSLETADVALDDILVTEGECESTEEYTSEVSDEEHSTESEDEHTEEYTSEVSGEDHSTESEDEGTEEYTSEVSDKEHRTESEDEYSEESTDKPDERSVGPGESRESEYQGHVTTGTHYDVF